MDILTVETQPKEKTTVFGIRLEESLFEKFKKMAQQRGMKPSGAARRLIRHYVETTPESKRSK